MKFTTTNPATERAIKEYAITGREGVHKAVHRARFAFEKWRKAGVSERAAYLKKASAEFVRNRKALAETITEEMGKPIKESLKEVDKCADRLDYYAKNAEKFLDYEAVETEAKKSMVCFEPLGVVGAIMPWNFPLSQIVRFAAPALAAGNAVVVKPSSVSPQCGLEVWRILRKADMPPGVFSVILGTAETGRQLIESGIDAVSFTGSVDAGRQIAEHAGKLMKKSVLELGGSDPLIVLEDADIDKAASAGVESRMSNCGQSCVAAKRFIVVRAVAEEFTAAFVERAKGLNVGDPKEEKTDMGPLVREDQRRTIEEQVKDAVKKGAKILAGGKRPDMRGYFYEPTVLTNVGRDMAVLSEETFGPVAPIAVAKSTEDAIRIANATEYGLGASLWTGRDPEPVIRQLDAGIVSVNSPVSSDNRLPFGGIKKSGTGRELSRYGIMEFVNIKSVKIF